MSRCVVVKGRITSNTTWNTSSVSLCWSNITLPLKGTKIVALGLNLDGGLFPIFFRIFRSLGYISGGNTVIILNGTKRVALGLKFPFPFAVIMATRKT